MLVSYIVHYTVHFIILTPKVSIIAVWFDDKSKQSCMTIYTDKISPVMKESNRSGILRSSDDQ